MFLFPFENFYQSTVFGVILMVLIKIYLVMTNGVCKSLKKLEGKTVVITGANTGIGKETALDLAKRGAHIVLACRNLQKASQAKADIIEKSGNKDVSIVKLDLASLASVRKCAAEIIKNEPRLDILINNAGCADFGKEATEDGLEYQMQINHFGHFLFTHLLLDLMIKTSQKKEDKVRIINVSSVANQFCWNKNFIEDVNFERDWATGTYFAFFRIYGASKLCNILFTNELAKKLEPHGITVNSLHPGAVLTEFTRFSKLFYVIMRTFAIFLKTPKEGAQTTIYLAVDDEVSGMTGKYFSDCKISNPSKLALDIGLARKLWEISEKIVKLQPEEQSQLL